MNKFVTLLLLLCFGSLMAQQIGPKSLQKATHMDISEPLRDIASRSVTYETTEPLFQIMPLQEAPGSMQYFPTGPQKQDNAWQEIMGNSGSGSVFAKWEGIGNLSGVMPPDISIAVGPDHVVQMLNLKFAIWDKEGTQLQAPLNINELWSGFGTGCQTGNDGDPIALYDHVADRWVLTQFDFSLAQCIACSETGDPLGAYYRYRFTTPGNDYPKMGVWHNAYTGTIRSFSGGFDMEAWAFEREAMLNGDVAQSVSFSLSALLPGIDGFLPVDIRGPHPSEDVPVYYLGHQDGPNRLALFEAEINWDSTSTISAPIFLDVDAYDSNLPSGVQQPSSQNLDALTGFTMMPLVYRDFGTHQSMVVNHTVDVNDFADHAGVRWYELRDEGAGWEVYQQGTYAPDADSRWMATADIAANGDIALGYTVSSNTTFPSIRFTGRKATDPLGTMTLPEETVVDGLASQGGGSRWGDYAHMQVDPVTDTTFWFSHEYVRFGGSFNWVSHIAHVGIEEFDPVNDLVVGPYTNILDQYFVDVPYDVTVQVFNNGQQEEVDVPVTLTANDSMVDSTSITIAADDTVEVTFSWTPLEGTVFGFPVTLTAEAFLETDETPFTNSATETVVVFDETGNEEIIFIDTFEAGDENWVITNDGGVCDWEVGDIGSNTYEMPPDALGQVLMADSDLCGDGGSILSTATLGTAVDVSTNDAIVIEFDSDWRTIDSKDIARVDVSADNGATWVNVLEYAGIDARTVHEAIDVSAELAGSSEALVRFVTIQPGWDWWWVIDNVQIIATGDFVPPTEGTANHVTSNLTASVTNEGNIGHLNEFPPAGPGSGFVVNNLDRMFEGALMVGTDAAHVSDAARDEDQLFDADFQFLSNIEDIGSTDSTTVLQSAYSDFNAEAPIGIEITETSITKDVAGKDKILWMQYDVFNTNPDSISLVLGAHFDWDVAATASDRGAVITDQTNTIDGMTFPIEILEQHTTGVYVGIVPLSHQDFGARRILINADEVWPPFMTDSDKWTYLSQNRATNPDGDDGTAADHGHGFGLPSTTIQAGESVRLGFAILGASSLDELIANAKTAQQEWVALGNTIELDSISVAIDDVESSLPTEFALHQNYPNPFNPSTTIRYDLKQAVDVSLKIYNVLGQEVYTLVNARQNAGRHEILWTGRTNSGIAAASGIYFYRIEAGSFNSIQKMMLIK